MTDSEFNPDWALKLKPDNIPEWIKPAPRWVLWRAETNGIGLRSTTLCVCSITTRAGTPASVSS